MSCRRAQFSLVVLTLAMMCTCRLFANYSETSASHPETPAINKTEQLLRTDRLNASPSFSNDIVPVLTRAGCNAASCHGAAAGRGGLQLSLFGSRPEFDYAQLTRELNGRRVNLTYPDASLLLRKPTGELEHEGGVRFDSSSAEYQTLLVWLQAGANYGESVELERIELVSEPTNSQEEMAEHDNEERDKHADAVQLTVRTIAHFKDGHSEDVTYWTRWEASDPTRVQLTVPQSLEEPLRLRVNSSGQHHLFAGFLSGRETLAIDVPFASAAPTNGDWSSANFVDSEVNEVLRKLALAPAGSATSYQLLRRSRLGLTGRLPKMSEVTALEEIESNHQTSDTSKDNFDYESWIDRLLASNNFDSYWTFQLKQYFRVSGERLREDSVAAIDQWLSQAVREDQSLAKVAREMITSLGDATTYGAPAMHLLSVDARAEAEYMSEVLLGVRLRCANCHDHPLDRWTQDDYHGLAATFASLRRESTVKDYASGYTIHPATGEPAQPKLPGDRLLEATGQETREAFADWLLEEPEKLFAKVMVNRVWKSLFGRGLVEPVDDLRLTNPSTHPELLNRLADYFIENDYRLKPLIRIIVVSKTYQRAPSPRDNQLPAAFLTHFAGHALSPEVMLDAISDVTNVHSFKMPSMAPHMTAKDQLLARMKSSTRDADQVREARRRWTEKFDPRTASFELEVLGRCPLGESCSEAATANEMTLPSILHLINGKLINHRVADAEGRLSRLLRKEATSESVVREFYQRALSRPPSSAEREHWRSRFTEIPDKDKKEAMEDWLWSLLNSREFGRNN